jgi:hypothetical protein
MIAHVTTTHTTDPDKLRRELLSEFGGDRKIGPMATLAARAKAQIAARAAAAKQP